MQTHRRTAVVLLSLTLTAVAVTGCAKHYRYTDVQSERVYYAKGGKVDKKMGGAVTFTDAVSGSKVTLQSYERDRISKSEFKDATDGE